MAQASINAYQRSSIQNTNLANGITWSQIRVANSLATAINMQQAASKSTLPRLYTFLSRGYATFNLSVIPAGSTVTGGRFQANAYSTGQKLGAPEFLVLCGNSYTGQLMNMPTVWAGTLTTRLSDDFVNLSTGTPSTDVFTFNAAGIAYVQNAIDTASPYLWFNLLLRSDQTDTDPNLMATETMFRYCASSQRLLTVDYTLTPTSVSVSQSFASGRGITKRRTKPFNAGDL